MAIDKKEPEQAGAIDKGQEQTGLVALAPMATAVIAVFTTVAGGLVAVGGGADRMLRNHPAWSFATLIVLALAIAFAAGALLMQRSPNPRVKGAASAFVVISFVGFAAGLITAIVTATLTSGDTYQPAITAEFTTTNGVAILNAEVKVSGLRSDQHVKIRVFPVGGDRAPLPRAIYLADDGPDVQGNVDTKLSLPLPLNIERFIQIQAWVGDTEPNCNTDLADPKVHLGCLLIPVPSRDEQPHLSAGIDGDPKQRVLLIKVKQSGVTRGESISLHVFGTKGKAAHVMIERASLKPDGFGNVDDQLHVVVPAGFTDVCVIAKSGSVWKEPSCPPPDDDNIAWLQIKL